MQEQKEVHDIQITLAKMEQDYKYLVNSVQNIEKTLDKLTDLNTRILRLENAAESSDKFHANIKRLVWIALGTAVPSLITGVVTIVLSLAREGII